MVVEFDGWGHEGPAQNGLTGDGPDALFGRFFDEDETVAGDAQQSLDLTHGSASAAVVVDVDLPADGAVLDGVGDEFRLQSLLLAAAERQDREFRAALQRVGRHVVGRQVLPINY